MERTMKVILLRFDNEPPIVYEDEPKRAKMRASALAQLHNAKIEEMEDGSLQVDARHYYRLNRIQKQKG